MVGTDERLQHLAGQAAYRLIAALEGRGVLDDAQTDPQADDPPLLAGLTAASFQSRTATGERAGRRLRRLLTDPSPHRPPCASPPAASPCTPPPPWRPTTAPD